MIEGVENKQIEPDENKSPSRFRYAVVRKIREMAADSARGVEIDQQTAANVAKTIAEASASDKPSYRRWAARQVLKVAKLNLDIWKEADKSARLDAGEATEINHSFTMVLEGPQGAGSTPPNDEKPA